MPHKRNNNRESQENKIQRFTFNTNKIITTRLITAWFPITSRVVTDSTEIRQQEKFRTLTTGRADYQRRQRTKTQIRFKKMEEKLQSIPQQPSTHFSSRSHLLPMQNPLIESLSVCGVCVNPIVFLKRIDKRDLGYHGPLPRHHLVTLLLFCVGCEVETNEDQIWDC